MDVHKEMPDDIEQVPLRGRVAAIIGTTFSVLLLLFLVAFVCWGEYVRRGLATYEAAAREAGQPVTLEDLNAWYPAVPASNNAALLFESAFRELEITDPAGTRTRDLYDRAINTEFHYRDWDRNQDDVLAFLEEQAAVLGILDEAVKKSASRYPLYFGNTILTEVTHLPHIKVLSRLLMLRGRAVLDTGELDRALIIQDQILRLGRSIVKEPILVSHQVRVDTNVHALRLMERILNRGNLTERQLSQLKLNYALGLPADTLERTFYGERCLLLAGVEQTYAGYIEPLEGGVLEDIATLRKFPPMIRNYFLMSDQVQIYHAYDVDVSEMEWPEVVKFSATENGWRKRHSEAKTISEHFVPRVVNGSHAFVRDVAVFRIARATIAVEEFMLAEGRYPSSLKELVPQYLSTVPADPYDGVPLRYHTGFVETRASYMIYTVMEDGKDEGGAQWHVGNKQGESGDLGVFIRRR